jgi:VWFA-related protein
VGSGPMASGPAVNGPTAPGAPSVAQTPVGSLTTKHIDDAIHAAAEILRGRDPQRRKIIVLVSDGVNANNNTHSYQDTLRLLLMSDISVYAIGVDAAVLRRGASRLSRYARDTGGDVYYTASAKALPDFYSRATEQARYQYTLGFVPSPSDHGTGFHSLEVRVRRSGLTVLARDGYFPLPPP